VHTDEPERRFAVGSVLATDPAEAGPLAVASVRWNTGRLLVGFDGITGRDQAEGLRGVWLTLDSAQAGSSDDPDEFHDHELIGLAVVTVSGEPVGRVTDVRHFGQDLLVIEPAGRAGAEPATAGPAGPVRPGQAVQPDGLLVPFVAAIVPEVDVAAGRLVIDPPPGLLELGAAEPGPG
jgi:16S rRNA processing protein RimM